MLRGFLRKMKMPLSRNISSSRIGGRRLLKIIGISLFLIWFALGCASPEIKTETVSRDCVLKAVQLDRESALWVIKQEFKKGPGKMPRGLSGLIKEALGNSQWLIENCPENQGKVVK